MLICEINYDLYWKSERDSKAIFNSLRPTEMEHDKSSTTCQWKINGRKMRAVLADVSSLITFMASLHLIEQQMWELRKKKHLFN